MKQFNKLVRDKIPEIIASTGKQAEIIVLSPEEYSFCLEKKLDEEVGEYHRDPSLEELVDILEVVYALAATAGCSQEQLIDAYQAKHHARGGFEKRLFLISVEE